MRIHRLLFLVLAALICSTAAAGENKTTYDLKELRALARAVHPSLESAESALAAAAGTLRQASAYPDPRLLFGIGRGQPRDGGGSRSEGRILLFQPIEVNGIRRWRKRAAELGLQTVELDRELSYTVVDSTVTRLVYTVLLERRRVEIARESVEVASRFHQLLAQRVEIGESSPLEAARARSEWFARRRVLVDATSALEAARAALDLFCDDRLPANFAIDETVEGPGTAELPDDLRQRLRTQNPTLIRARVEIERAQARTKVERKKVLPRFDLIAAYNQELDREAASLGAGLTIPLWNRNRGAIATAGANEARATFDARALVQELERALARAVAAYEGARAAIQLHRDGWTATARRAVEISSFSFENGEASLLDVLDAQRSYLGVRSDEAESWAALGLARTEIERLLSGPLKPEDTDESP